MIGQAVSTRPLASWSHQPLLVTLSILSSDLSPPEVSRPWRIEAVREEGLGKCQPHPDLSCTPRVLSLLTWATAGLTFLSLKPMCHRLSAQVGFQEGILAFLPPLGRPGPSPTLTGRLWGHQRFLGRRDSTAHLAHPPQGLLCLRSRNFHPAFSLPVTFEAGCSGPRL